MQAACLAFLESQLPSEMHIDIATVILLFNSSAFTATLALWHLRTQSSNKSGLLELGAGFALLGFSSLLAGLGEFNLVHKIVWTHFSMLGGIAGNMLLVVGYRALNYGRTRGYILAFSITLLLLAIVSLCSGFWAIDNIRASVYVGFSGVVLALAAYKVVNKNRTEPLPSRIPLSVCLLTGSLVYLGMLWAIQNQETYRAWVAWGFAVELMLHFLETIFIYGLVKERIEKKLRYASEIDPLTQVGNRRWFENNAPAEPSKRDGIIVLDVDFFKKINDQYGHPFGDAVLQAIAAEINSAKRENDLLARYGGEEFILFIDEVERHELLQIAERLRTTAQNIQVGEQPLPEPVTISLGLAWNDGSFKSLQAMIAAADQALYLSKNNGRNTLTLYDPVTSNPHDQPSYSEV